MIQFDHFIIFTFCCLMKCGRLSVVQGVCCQRRDLEYEKRESVALGNYYNIAQLTSAHSTKVGPKASLRPNNQTTARFFLCLVLDESSRYLPAQPFVVAVLGQSGYIVSNHLKRSPTLNLSFFALATRQILPNTLSHQKYEFTISSVVVFAGSPRRCKPVNCHYVVFPRCTTRRLPRKGLDAEL